MRLPRIFARQSGREDPRARSARPASAAPWGRSGFAAAGVEHVFAGWTGATGTLEFDLRGALLRMRARSRELARDNDYMKHFLQLVCSNVVGPQGVKLRVQARDPDGGLDEAANRLIEAAWARWGRHGVCTADGRLSWIEVQALAMRLIARDGEVLLRELPGFGNGFAYALQLIPADALDESLHRGLTDGGEIRYGCEVDRWNRPVAYWLRVRERDRYLGTAHERVPAAQMLHLFLAEDALQSRGLPWVHASTRRLAMLGGFEEAAITNARVGAAKMGFFANPEGGAFPGPDGTAADGLPQMRADPGSFEVLPQGYTFQSFDPEYPNGETEPFLKAMLRGVAAGLGVSYTSLTGDLEGTNMSSIRAGLLEERGVWMGLQQWLIERLHDRVFRNWLPATMTTQAVPLPLMRLEKFQQPHWFPRRWTWVDPLKDAQTAAASVALGLQSRTALAAEQGRDIQTVMAELAEEERLAAAAGVSLARPSAWQPIEDDEEDKDDG